MASAPLDPAVRRRLLDLVRSDREAAGALLDALSVDERLAAVCEAPPAARGLLLGLLDAPEEVIPRLPEAELCFTVKAVGLHDAAWILEHATPEQIVAGVDLDVWEGHDLDVATLGEWIEALATIERPALLRAVQSLDPELLVLLLQSRIEVFQKPTGDEDFVPPEGCQTLEGQFYFRARREGDDLQGLVLLLRTLFESDYWTYFRMMQGSVWETPSDASEWALRWRTGRLEDLGFPPWDEAMRIYRFIKPRDRARLDAEARRPLDVSPWSLPVWLPRLPEKLEADYRIFRAISELDDEERRACFYAFVGVSNKIAVADRMPLSDAESTPRAIEKAARFASDGLAHVAQETGLSDAQILRRVSIDRLFSVGANLDPESARP